MNRYLPRDIVIKRIEEMPERFIQDIMRWAKNTAIMFGTT